MTQSHLKTFKNDGKLSAIVSITDMCLKFTAQTMCVHLWILPLPTLATTSVEAKLAHHHQNDYAKLHLLI